MPGTLRLAALAWLPLLGLAVALPHGQADENEARAWAYRSPVRPVVPSAPGGSNPIDAFIHARLGQVGLQMSPAADRLTLLRRVTFDLTGLPPTLAEVALAISTTCKRGTPNSALARIFRRDEAWLNLGRVG